jgi:hypothetical protein
MTEYIRAARICMVAARFAVTHKPADRLHAKPTPMRARMQCRIRPRFVPTSRRPGSGRRDFNRAVPHNSSVLLRMRRVAIRSTHGYRDNQSRYR